MKQFLRYQISGMVFLLWLFIFLHESSSLDHLESLIKSLKNEKMIVVIGIASALPIGVIIHQFSVLIKNWILAKFFCLDYLSDMPDKRVIDQIDKDNPKIDYILERISSLNSFYYVRFDNGVLAPFMAYISACNLTEYTLKNIDLAIVIGAVTSVYLYRIYKELGEYKSILISYQKEKDRAKIFG